MSNYTEFVKALKKPSTEILESVTADETDLWHQTFALIIEVGELADPIKKHIIYRKELDIDNVIEELGDIEFYLEAIRQNLNIRRSDTIEANMVKLKKRYPNLAYSDKDAITRADKND